MNRPRALSLLAIAASAVIAGCGNDGPDDPAIAVAGSGIPMAPPNASGVRFDAPIAQTEPTSGRLERPRGLPHPLPPDPFAPGGDAGAPTGPRGRPPRKSGGTNL